MITASDMTEIVDAIERIVLRKGEELRQEFYGAIQQLIANQQALAEMLASHNNPDVMTVLAHDMWQRGVMMEADRIKAQLNDVWEGLVPKDDPEPKPLVKKADPELERLLAEEEEIERQAREANPLIPIDDTPQRSPICPICGSDDPDSYRKIRYHGDFMPCHHPWHDR